MRNEPPSDPTLISVNVASSIIQLTDEDILAQLANFENSFVERKSEGDSKDWLKTVVAFANTTPMGYPAIMFVGVKNDGTIQGTANLDTLQKSLSQKLEEAYPPIFYLTKVLERGGKQFLAVVIPGSERRPHFAGQAFVRDGSKTVVASNEQLTRLVAERNSKAYEILKWRGKKVTLALPGGGVGTLAHPSSVADVVIVDCNQFYVTYTSAYASALDQKSRTSQPLALVEVSFDHGNQRLELRLRRE